MTRRISADEQAIAELTIDRDRLRVTTSAAPNTVRVYHGDALACTISGLGTVVRRPSWAAVYLSRRSETWRALVERCVIAEVNDLNLPGADPITGQHAVPR